MKVLQLGKDAIYWWTRIYNKDGLRTATTLTKIQFFHYFYVLFNKLNNTRKVFLRTILVIGVTFFFIYMHFY